MWTSLFSHSSEKWKTTSTMGIGEHTEHLFTAKKVRKHLEEQYGAEIVAT